MTINPRCRQLPRFIAVAFLIFPGVILAQPSPEKLFIGGEAFAVGMAQEEAMKKLEKCCFVAGGKNQQAPKAYFIMNKSQTDFLGGIWFRDKKVERVERFGEFSQDPATISFAVSLYRLLSEHAPLEPATIVLQTGTSEATNGSSKSISFIFRDGRSVQMEIATPDDQQKSRNQVSLKESLGKP